MPIRQILSTLLTGPTQQNGHNQQTYGSNTGNYYPQNTRPSSNVYQTGYPQAPAAQPYAYPTQQSQVNYPVPPNANQYYQGAPSYSPQTQPYAPPPPPPRPPLNNPPSASGFPPNQPPNHNQHQFNQPFTWGPFILANNYPNPLFTRLLDGIFNYFIQTPPTHPLGFDPIKFAAAFTALQYSDSNNKVRAFFIFATQNSFPNPEQFVYDVMPFFYRAFSIPYTTHAGLPVLTREGFHALFLMDTLGDPEVTWRRLNMFMAAHGNAVLDPATGMPFPVREIPRTALPHGADAATWERVRRANVVFNQDLGEYLREMIRMQRWKHDITMSSMSDGVWIQLVPH